MNGKGNYLTNDSDKHVNNVIFLNDTDKNKIQDKLVSIFFSLETIGIKENLSSEKLVENTLDKFKQSIKFNGKDMTSNCHKKNPSKFI